MVQIVTRILNLNNLYPLHRPIKQLRYELMVQIVNQRCSVFKCLTFASMYNLLWRI